MGSSLHRLIPGGTIRSLRTCGGLDSRTNRKRGLEEKACREPRNDRLNRRRKVVDNPPAAQEIFVEINNLHVRDAKSSISQFPLFRR